MISFVCLAALPFAGPALTTPAEDEVPVKATPGIDELDPAAGSGYFAWSQNSIDRPAHFDAFAQGPGGRPFKVNARNTQGRVGAISSRTLVFQQSLGRQSDIKFFDLRTRRRSDPPRAVNSKDWESHPSLSGKWLLFSRLHRATATERVLLRNLKTGEQRTVFKGTPSQRVYAGRVNNNYAVFTYCGAQCSIILYDIAEKTFVPVLRSPIPSKQDFGPSVTGSGTAYFARVFAAYPCHSQQEIRLMRVALNARQGRIVKAMPASLGIDSTYVVSSAGEDTLYYSRGICSRGSSDIYALKVGETP